MTAPTGWFNTPRTNTLSDLQPTIQIFGKAQEDFKPNTDYFDKMREIRDTNLKEISRINEKK